VRWRRHRRSSRRRTLTDSSRARRKGVAVRPLDFGSACRIRSTTCRLPIEFGGGHGNWGDQRRRDCTAAMRRVGRGRRMPFRAMRFASCVLVALTFTGGVASAKLPRPYKPNGGYEVVVTGTGTLELNLASAPWTCGGQAENLLLLKGVYRSTLAAKSAALHRAQSWTRKSRTVPTGRSLP
jgi:hypothetical protein